MNTEFLTVTEMTQKLIVKYDLQYESEDDFSSFRQKVSRALKETKIWDRGFDNEVGKRKAKLFTTSQMLELEASKQMYTYLSSRSRNNYHNRPSYDEINKHINSRRLHALENYSGPTITNTATSTPTLDENEFRNFMDRMMLRAIFEVFYTPIDEELLRKDYFTFKYLTDEADLDIEDIDREKRFEHPEGSYYERRPK